MYGPHKARQQLSYGLSSSGRGFSLLRVTMHLSDVWLLGSFKETRLVSSLLKPDLTLFQRGKCFVLQQFHLRTTPSLPLSLSSFPLSPRCPYLLNPLAKSLWEQETWRANRWAQLLGYHWCCILRSCVPKWLQWQYKQCLLELSKKFLSTSFCLETFI